ncbi:TRAP transporter small permease [Pararhodobacter oceanensis]|uniref:TRAP transporter small permease n=1 Tax=Pararhodobacter oceanensis TaxID=2172121 RepID=UPI003A94B3A0
MIRKIATGLDRLSATLNTIALWGAVLAVLVMVFAAGWQVIARYVFAAPPIWTEELARRAMVWAGMLGASAAYYARADPSLFPQAAAIKGRLGNILSLIRATGVLMFAVPVIWFSLYGPNMNLARGFLGRSLSRTAEMIPLPMIFFTAAVPLAFALIVLHLTARLAMQLSGADTEDPKS